MSHDHAARARFVENTLRQFRARQIPLLKWGPIRVLFRDPLAAVMDRDLQARCASWECVYKFASLTKQHDIDAYCDRLMLEYATKFAFDWDASIWGNLAHISYFSDNEQHRQRAREMILRGTTVARKWAVFRLAVHALLVSAFFFLLYCGIAQGLSRFRQ